MIWYFSYETIKVRKKVISLKFQIFKNGKKIKKDFHEKKKLLLQNSTTKALETATRWNELNIFK